MGAWGTGIFSDDTADDVRTEYRWLLEDRVADQEATLRVIAANDHLTEDQEHVLWLALAAAQHQVGRLEDGVKERALAVIDSGEGLELWEEAGSTELARRKAALAKLRDKLTGPQPARKAVRRPWRHVTDLAPGTVLGFTASSGDLALLRVLRVKGDRIGAFPVLERLDWRGRAVPSMRKVRRLKPRQDTDGFGPPADERYVVSRFRKRDLDWAEAGFVVVGEVPPRRRDRSCPVTRDLQWRALRTILEQELAASR